MSTQLRKQQRLPKLTEVEMWIGEQVGKRRDTLAKTKGARQRIEGGDSVANNIGGAQAELAFAKAINVYPAETLQITLPGKPDLVTYNRRTVEVKWNPRNVDLLVPVPSPDDKDPPERADYYVVVCGNYFVFNGWAKREDVFRPENVKDLGKKDKDGNPALCYVVRAKDLRALFNS